MSHAGVIAVPSVPNKSENSGIEWPQCCSTSYEKKKLGKKRNACSFEVKGSKSQQAPAGSGVCNDSSSLTKPALMQFWFVLFGGGVFFRMPLTHTSSVLREKGDINLCDVLLESSWFTYVFSCPFIALKDCKTSWFFSIHPKRGGGVIMSSKKSYIWQEWHPAKHCQLLKRETPPELRLETYSTWIRKHDILRFWGVFLIPGQLCFTFGKTIVY